jgi:hypothetical protein
VRVTHRFHPLSGRSFEFVNRRKSWQSDRVYFFDDAGELACLPAEWTDVVPGDPFVVVSAGRSPFLWGSITGSGLVRLPGWDHR